MELLSILLPSLAAIATALFAILRWSRERRADRRKEEARLAALYTNPFVSACEDLQSRLYKIIKGRGLDALLERSSPEVRADQTLYLIARYFAWARIVYRYGSYTRDPAVVGLTETIRDIFSTDDLKTVQKGIGPFCFFRIEQDNLANIAIKPRRGEYGPEFDDIPFLEFREKLKDLKAKDSMDSVKKTLSALEGALTVKDLYAKDRLALVQNYLVDLLSYIEGREKFSLYLARGKRLKVEVGKRGKQVQEKRYSGLGMLGIIRKIWKKQEKSANGSSL